MVKSSRSRYLKPVLSCPISCDECVTQVISCSDWSENRCIRKKRCQTPDSAIIVSAQKRPINHMRIFTSQIKKQNKKVRLHKRLHTMSKASKHHNTSSCFRGLTFVDIEIGRCHKNTARSSLPTFAYYLLVLLSSYRYTDITRVIAS